jgi:hypothetical protein
MITIMYWFLMASVSAHREVEILIDGGHWNIGMTWLKFWGKDWTGTKRLFNSFHAMWGLWWAMIVFYIVTQAIWYYLYGQPLMEMWLLIIGKEIGWALLSVGLNILIYWQMYMYFRNINMHIVFMNPKYMRLSVLLPIKFDK